MGTGLVSVADVDMSSDLVVINMGSDEMSSLYNNGMSHGMISL